MPGLLQQPGHPAPAPAAPPPPAPAPMGPDAAPDPSQQGQPNVTPEEQTAYNELVSRSVILVYDEKATAASKKKTIRPAVLASLKAGDDPATALGTTAGTIINRVFDAADKGGIEIDPDMHEQAAADMFEGVAQAATEAGVHDFQGDDAAFKKAFLIAADTMRQHEVETGKLTQEQAQADMQALSQADQEGKLDGIMGQLGGQA